MSVRESVDLELDQMLGHPMTEDKCAPCRYHCDRWLRNELKGGRCRHRAPSLTVPKRVPYSWGRCPLVLLLLLLLQLLPLGLAGARALPALSNQNSLLPWDRNPSPKSVPSELAPEFIDIVHNGNVAELDDSSRGDNTDSCDWIGSGLDYNESSRGIEPVYVRCTQGRIVWKFPRGGLRIVMRIGGSGKEFFGCIKPSAESRGARIYLEGQRNLYLLHSPRDDQSGSSPLCFTSTAGQVALYAEAEPENDATLDNASLKNVVTEFSYDLDDKPRNTFENPNGDCSPCTDQELLYYYCTADFVVRGTIYDLTQNEAEQRTELSVKATDIHHQNNHIFLPLETDGSVRFYHGRVHVPKRCAVTSGTGEELLFIGRFVLGEPKIWCAPRIEEWLHLKNKALSENAHQCRLK